MLAVLQDYVFANFKRFARGGDKVVKQKDLSSPLTKTPESQLTAEQPSTTRRHEPTKKDILHLKIKKEPQIDGRRGAYTLIKAHTCQVGDK